MSTPDHDRIRDHAARLGLTHLTETITELVDRAEAAQMGYLDFVDLLLEEEVGLREGRRFRNALKLSGLPHHKTLDEFDFAFQPDLDARKIRDLATLEFVRAKSNIALLGPPGSAKPCSPSPSPSPPAKPDGRSTSPLWMTWSADSAPPKPPAGSAGNSKPSSDPPSSSVDEVGYLPLDRAEANMVFQLVSRRYERGTMIITIQQELRRMGRRPRRRRPRHRHPRPPAAPLRRDQHQRPQLPPQRPPHPRHRR